LSVVLSVIHPLLGSVHLLKLVVGVHDHVGIVGEIIGGHGAALAEEVVEQVGAGNLGQDLDEQREGKDSQNNRQPSLDEISWEKGPSVQPVGAEASLDVEPGVVVVVGGARVVRKWLLVVSGRLKVAAEAGSRGVPCVPVRGLGMGHGVLLGLHGLVGGR